MENIKYAVLISLCVLGQIFGCTLDRNKHNPYPFVLKVAVDGVLRCHAVLLTPGRVISASVPVEHYVDAKNFSHLSFIGQLRGPGGTLVCSASRHPQHAFKAAQRDRNMLFWQMEKRFDVTVNHPYLFPHLEDLTYSMMQRNINDTFDEECCVLPVFNSKSEDAKIVAGSVTFISGNMSDYWANVFCKNDSSCIASSQSRRFFAYDPAKRPSGANWYKGSVIICNQHPLGILSSVIKDSESHEITVFEPFGYVAKLMHEYAEGERNFSTQTGGSRMKMSSTSANIQDTAATAYLCLITYTIIHKLCV